MAMLMWAGPETATAHDIAGVESGESGYYGYELAGSPTATGEPFNPEGLTAAHPWLPLGSYVTICLQETGLCVDGVRINDRGPATWTGRIIDPSLGTARTIGLDALGIGTVTVYY